MKKSLPILLIFLMMFSNIAMASPLQKTAKTLVNKTNTTEKIHRQFSKSISKKEAEKSYKSTDKVRVIVEVEGSPAITYATEKGKKYSELSKSVKTKLQNKALAAQDAVKRQFTSKSIKMQFKQKFTTAFNGFSGIVEYGQIPKIEGVQGVKKVTIAHEYQRPIEKPEMKYSKDIVQAQQAWQDYGYKGEGMVIGIIDTGIDPSHRDMVISDPSKAALSKEKVDGLVADKGLHGKFYTDKVPYGYNYADDNDQILDLGEGASMHGMHVSGIAAANGDEDNGGIKGVAPEAQLLALKVFGNDQDFPSTWSDIYVKAIDDAIILGADVLNMSLGSTSAFVLPDDPEQQAIDKAVDNGVFMSISAGNSGTISYGLKDLGGNTIYPFASNPDIGVVGAPGLYNNSLQVASIENNYMDLDAITYSFNGEQAGKAPFLSAGSADPTKLQQTYDVVYAGLGRLPGDSTANPNADDFAGLDLTGKFALIQRGESSFVSKTLNAQKAGAAGVIIFNNTDGYVNMVSDPTITIPQLFILKPDGNKLKTELANGTEVKVEFKGDKVTALNPLAGQMSDFTSWGVTPNLDFKPEITAPGGNIYSTFNNNQYGVMSGTSMAAPHVSGGSALVLERVKKDFSNLTGKAKVQMAKNILMNTSKIVEEQGYYNNILYNNYGIEKSPISPRRQGAGVMQLDSALSTPIVVTNTATNEAKVALKEIDGDKATFTLKAENFSKDPVTYNINGNVQTDFQLGDNQNYLEAGGIYSPTGEFPISFSKDQITVPGNGTETVEVTIDLKDAQDLFGDNLSDVFKNGYFVEGFVTLTDVNDVNPAISVPYVGFKGDWNKSPVLDETIYDGKAADSMYQWTGMLSDSILGYDYLGYDPKADPNADITDPENTPLKSSHIAISPNGDGVNDDALPILSFLRNAKLVEYKILDKDKNVLRKLKSDVNVRKNFYDAGNGTEYYINPANTWDGKVKNKLVADGTYYYEVDSTIDYPGKEPQKIQFPVIVDTKVPEVNANLSDNKLTINSEDKDGSGIAYVDVLVNGQSVFTDPTSLLSGGATEYTFDQAPASNDTIEVIAYDYAGNANKFVVNDKTIPYIHVFDPQALGIYNTNVVPLSGYVAEAALSDLSVKVDDQEEVIPIELVYKDIYGYYAFSTMVNLEDGVHKLKISGKDASGNEINFSREVMVDATAPEIDVNVPKKVKKDVTSVDLKATISDNFDQLRYFVDGSEEFYKEFTEPYAMRSFSKEVTTHLDLEPGDNTFTINLVDVAGNKTTKEITIFRGDPYKVKYLDNGNVLKTEEVFKDDTIAAQPADPTKSGYTFIGWYKDENFKTKFDFSAPIVADTNIYARFVKNPDAPTSVKAASADYDKITVSWAKVSGASGYEIYRATSSNGSYSKLTTIPSGSTVTYTNSGLATGQTYYYKVVAYTTVDGVKVNSSYSNVVSGKSVLTAPASPKAAKASYNSIKISWDKVSGASGYEVYRATSYTGSYTKVTTLSSGSTVSYTNNDLATGQTYYYKVKAYRTVNGTKVYGSYSSIVSGKSTLDAPSNLKAAKASSTSIKATWIKVSGASGYELYRATSKSGSFTKVKTITSGSSYTNTKLTKGKTYYYKVRAYRTVDGKKVYSSYSIVVSRSL